MTSDVLVSQDSLKSGAEAAASELNTALLRKHPGPSARMLEALAPEIAAAILVAQSPQVRLPVWGMISPSAASLLLPYFDDAMAVEALSALDPGSGASLLSQLEQAHRDHYLKLVDEALAHELRDLLDFPMDSAGHIMDPRVLGFSSSVSVREVMLQLRRYPTIMRRRIFTLDKDNRLQGQVELAQLVVAEPDQTLAEISVGLTGFVSALDRKDEVADMLQKNNIEALPVVDIHQRLVGVIRGASAIEALKEGIAVDIQTMVGVSRDEQALSSSIFAVRKRQGWLQINLLTGFLAAAVVGIFESTIAQFTALAILMPVAAGQSGNTGAQALAVTMRGLTLREITARHWLRVLFKEAGAGLLNGIAIAVTCGAGVYLWSKSFGLALVIALAMVISMTIAGIGGALVPICLKQLGQDPAQSSSIILTTITDIAGFMSFLGIATLLAPMLVAG